MLVYMLVVSVKKPPITTISMSTSTSLPVYSEHSHTSTPCVPQCVTHD